MLRVAFAQNARGGWRDSDAQLIGKTAHAVLEELVRSGAIWNAGERATAHARFSAELARVAGNREVRKARVQAARLRKLVEQLHSLLEGAGADAATLCEQELVARDGALKGVVDLVIDSPDLHAVVDYKTGAVVDDEGEPLAHYIAQLRIYAVLEQERSGRWPTRGVLLRFGGQAVEIALVPEECDAEAQAAIEAREAFNRITGRVPPANPGAQTCRYCSFAARCAPFWEAASQDWQGRGAVRGVVEWVEASAAGGVTVALRDAIGTQTGDAIVRRLPLTPTLSAVRPGDALAIAGVWLDSEARLVADRSVSFAVVQAA